MLATSASPALAHLRLVSASPAAGAELTRAPDEIRLHFSQPVETGFSSIALEGPSGPVAIGAIVLAVTAVLVATPPG